MDADAARKKRLEELEAKRKRLDEMKKARAQNTEGAAASATVAPPQPPASSKVDTVPPTVASTSVSRTATLSANTHSVASSAKTVSAIDTDEFVSSLLANISMTAPAAALPDQPSALSVHSPKEVLISSSRTSAKRSNAFVTVRACSALIMLPATLVSYDKSCQTEERSEPSVDHSERSPDSYTSPKARMRRTISQSQSTVKSKVDADCEDVVIGRADASVAKRKLSALDRELIMSDLRFNSFLRSASLHVERAIEFGERFDIFKDYSAVDDAQSVLRKANQSESMEIIDSFVEDTLAGRPINDIRFSSSFSDLFLVAYGTKGFNSNIATARLTNSLVSPNVVSTDGDPGLVCIWSKEMHKRPEMWFSASSAVLSAVFHPLEPQLIIGGCHNGQILLWDMRAGKSGAIQRSSLTGRGHKHPVYCLSFKTSALSLELLTVSVDGFLCVWDVSRLTEPTSTVNLVFPSIPGKFSSAIDFSSVLQSPSLPSAVSSSPLNVSCWSHAQHDNVSTVLIGSGTGQLLKAQIPYKPASTDNCSVDAHFGLVTSVQMHPFSNNHKYKNLALTCSLDWTIKLWNISQSMDAPIYEFVSPTSDYVVDVQWSPTHAAIFATVTSTGKVCLWNISKSITEPLDIIVVAATTSDSGKAVALNRAIWSRDGAFIFVGDSAGVVHKIKVSSQFTASTQGDENKLELLLASASRLKAKHGESCDFRNISQSSSSLPA